MPLNGACSVDRNRSNDPLADIRDSIRFAEDDFLDLWREHPQPDDLRDTCAGDTDLPGDFGVVGEVARSNGSMDWVGEDKLLLSKRGSTTMSNSNVTPRLLATWFGRRAVHPGC